MINNIGNRTFCHPVWSVIILMIKQIRPFPMWMSDFVIIVWLQTELESAQSFYHYSQLFASKWNGFDFILPGHSAHQSSIGDQQQLQGPCIQASKAVQQTHVLNILLPSLYHNKYIPQCNRHGYFKPMQCNHNRKKCWCVDKWGNKKGKHIKGHPDELDCS